MGLDMYLERKIYVGNKFRNKDEKIKIKIPKKQEKALFKVEKINEDKVSYIIEEVGNWRKANAIHKWFVDNIQKGNDDCGNYMVSRGELQNLLNICKEVLSKCKIVEGKVQNGYRFNSKGEKIYNYEKGKIIANPEVAEELLPSQEGFFFGGTEYDEYYIGDIKYTIEILEEVLKTKQGDIYYSSSW